jgi:tRNA G10  N-methylase Trm11
MSTYLCVLGSTPELSLAELQSVLTTQTINLVRVDVAAIELESDQRASELMDILGGTVKILKSEQTLTDSSPESITQILIELLSQNEGKVTFSVGEIGRDHLPKIELGDIKQQLKEQGISVRYVEAPRSGLSAAVLLHHKQVKEYLIIQTESSLLLAKTVAVQNIDEWTVRDRSKPYANRRKGMLPPKVARMMVNLATQGTVGGTLYDPFCGTGTILAEALLMGCHVVGSDLDADSATGSDENLAWLKKTYDVKGQVKVFASDVSQVHPTQFPRPIDYLVTEPFLGKQTPKPDQLANIFKGLEKLYLGAFKAWTRILADGARVVMIFPKVNLGKHPADLKSLIDKLAGLGYTMESETLNYHRPGAVVEREIHIFRYTKRK